MSFGMPRSAGKRIAVRLSPRFRVFYGEEIALGPGKVKLLKAIRETGSIRQAASDLEMSYMRAWTLVRTMNSSFNFPVVEALRGGEKHGGASLTATGQKVLKTYDRMEQKAIKATQADWKKLCSLLRT